MVEVQILSKILQTKSMSIIIDNELNEDYFNSYKEQFDFIQNHFRNYGTVPDKETFLYEFPEFEIIDVEESNQFMVDTIREEYVYSKTVPIINNVADKMKKNSYDAVKYLQGQIEYLSELVSSKNPPLDLIKTAQSRLEKWEEKKEDSSHFYIPTGFQELDELLGGWDREGELAVILMRTSQGKSWLLQNSLIHAWKIGKRVGMYEPEMSSIKTGYRFDTLYGHFSNSAINKGEDAPGYESYIDELKNKDNPFYLIPSTEHLDVPGIKKFIQDNKIEIMGIDGISYLSDYRASRYDSLSTSLTHIAEDLMAISIELKVPILTVVQSNRGDERGRVANKFPDLFNVRDSDGISYNSTLVISGYHENNTMHLKITKSRGSEDNKTIVYYWNIDKGEFRYVPDNQSDEEDEDTIEDVRREYEDEEDTSDVF